MIARLKGIVEALETDSVILDVNGVGYLVFASSRTLGTLAVGEAAALWVETNVREDHIHLYGFLSVDERDWFRLLTTVQGVGAKVGLALLSVLPGDQMLQAIAAGDKAAISRAPGVGPKLAGRICSELKDKVGALALGAAAKSSSVAPSVAPAVSEGRLDGDAALIRDAASALTNLGYAPSDALGAVSVAAQALGEGASLDALIKGGLSELALKG